SAAPGRSTSTSTSRSANAFNETYRQLIPTIDQDRTIKAHHNRQVWLNNTTKPFVVVPIIADYQTVFATPTPLPGTTANMYTLCSLRLRSLLRLSSPLSGALKPPDSVSAIVQI